MFLSSTLDTPMLLEGTMLACFGLAWPLANYRMLRTGVPHGKGMGFTLVILFGYLCGALAKLLLAARGPALAPVFWLYALNASSVGTNLFLQWHLRPKAQAACAGVGLAGLQAPTASKP